MLCKNAYNFYPAFRVMRKICAKAASFADNVHIAYRNNYRHMIRISDKNVV